jgi:UDP:flavonoid glycosyltransferase YjiC (YdhE family)
MGALRHGLPCVLVPLAAGDNWRNAGKVERLGTGIAIHKEARSAGAVRDAVTAVLTEPTYRAAARGLAASIASLPPTSHAATMLERLARERQPIQAEPRRSQMRGRCPAGGGAGPPSHPRVR